MDVTTLAEPARIDNSGFRFDHLELWVGNARQAAYYYCGALGFRAAAYRGPETGQPDSCSYVLVQNGVRIVVTSGLTPDDAAGALRRAVAAANDAVAFARESIGGNPGTTLILAIISGTRTSVANVGDSRGYLISSSGVTQVTEDHSWAAGQVRLGALDAEAARHHPKRNLIERAVMGDPVEADIFDVDAAAGDVLLLCSDGLWEPLSDQALGAIVATPDPLGVALTRACDAALAGGGTDNVTIVAARWLPLPSGNV